RARCAGGAHETSPVPECEPAEPGYPLVEDDMPRWLIDDDPAPEPVAHAKDHGIRCMRERSRRAMSYFTLAQVLQKRGRAPDASQAVAAGLKYFDRLGGEDSPLPMHRAEAAALRANAAAQLFETNRFAEAEQLSRQTVSLYLGLVAELPDR